MKRAVGPEATERSGQRGWGRGSRVSSPHQKQIVYMFLDKGYSLSEGGDVGLSDRKPVNNRWYAASFFDI